MEFLINETHKVIENIKNVPNPNGESSLKKEDQRRKTSVTTNNQTLKVLSLFSGCGGMDLGFEGGFRVHRKSVPVGWFMDRPQKGFGTLARTRFQTVFSNDILAEAKSTWQNFFAGRKTDESIFHHESIVELVKKHHSGINVFPRDIDVVTGGFPCNDFSVSGLRKGFNSHKDHNGKIFTEEIPTEETRGKLYMWMKAVIDITEPKIFIAENVKGLVSLGDAKRIIQSDFSSSNGNGYIVLDPIVLHSADYGVPQSRERVIFIGIKKSALKPKIRRRLEGASIPASINPYPIQTHGKEANDGRLPWVTLKDIFTGLPEPEESDDPSQQCYSKAKFMGSHCQGQTEIKLNSIAPTIRAEHHGNIEFRRLSRTNGGKLKTELNKGLKERRLTVRECALIQTFPPEYEFVFNNPASGLSNSASAAYKVIGNAVPPLLAYHIARRLETLWPIYFGE